MVKLKSLKPPVNPFLPDILSDFLILGRTSCCRQLVFWTIDQVTGYFLKCSDITIIFYTNWLFFCYKKCGNTVIFTQETQNVSSSKLRPDNFPFLKGLIFLTTMIFLCLCTTNSQANKTSQLTGGRLVNFMCKRRFEQQRMNQSRPRAVSEKTPRCWVTKPN